MVGHLQKLLQMNQENPKKENKKIQKKDRRGALVISYNQE
jgi:hypothetical protein